MDKQLIMNNATEYMLHSAIDKFLD